MKTQVQGSYVLRVKSPGGIIKREAECKNVITDLGMNRLGNTHGGAAEYIRVGTGTTTADPGDQQLVNQIAATNNRLGYIATDNSGAPLYRSRVTFTWQFAQGAVVGNIAEIGVGWAATGATLLTRSRILDISGLPTTISVLADEILEVAYSFDLYPTTSDFTGSITISGTTYNYTGRSANIQYTSAYALFGQYGAGNSNFSVQGYQAGCSLGPITGTLSGVGLPSGNAAVQSYVNNSYELSYEVSFGINAGNGAGGLGGFAITFHHVAYQVVFDTPIPKDNTKILTFGIKQSWGRY